MKTEQRNIEAVKDDISRLKGVLSAMERYSTHDMMVAHTEAHVNHLSHANIGKLLGVRAPEITKMIAAHRYIEEMTQ